jgi:hypothetical protein
VRPEDRERIPVAAFHEGLEAGFIDTGEKDVVTRRHSWPPLSPAMRRCTMVDRPLSGIVSHFGRLDASYWISYAAFSSRNRSSRGSRLS